jgi:uncharacterized protein Yka (UPF0111/DUF47 family)
MRDQIVDEIEAIEDACDDRRLELGWLVTNVDAEELGLRLTQVHVHADRLLALHSHLDSIANSAEQFAFELTATDPKRCGDCLDGLEEMAEIAVTAMTHLDTAVSEFVRALCRPRDDVSITTSVSSIRALEGEADAVRNEILEAAFTDDLGADALAYRQLALILDDVLDAMEDVTDQMHLVTGSEAWFDVDIYPPWEY